MNFRVYGPLCDGASATRIGTAAWGDFRVIAGGMWREMYPEALIEWRLFVIDRDRFTCADGIAPLDMAHALIASHHGVELAYVVSDWFIHASIRHSTGRRLATA